MNTEALVCFIFRAYCVTHARRQDDKGCGDVISEGPRWEQLSKELTVGSLIYVIGKPNNDAEVFQIDLEHVNSQAMSSLRMISSFKNQTTIASSYLGTHYGKKYQKGAFPFKQGQWFTMVIRVKETQYVIYVDGREYFTFDPEFGYFIVHYIELGGDFSFLRPIVINP